MVRSVVDTPGWAHLGARGGQAGYEVGRHRCQPTPVAIAWFNPWWASEVTPSTPLRRREFRDLRQASQKSGAHRRNGHSQHFPWVRGIDAGACDHADIHDAAAFPYFPGQSVRQYAGIGTAVQGFCQKIIRYVVQVPAEADPLAFQDAIAGHAFDQIVDTPEVDTPSTVACWMTANMAFSLRQRSSTRLSK